VTDDDLVAALADRAAWTVDAVAAVATYEPISGGWRAVIRELQGSGRGYDRYDRWHVAVLDGGGRCHYAKPEVHLSEALRSAEGQVNARA
jgi:hypothetical protein